MSERTPAIRFVVIWKFGITKCVDGVRVSKCSDWVRGSIPSAYFARQPGRNSQIRVDVNTECEAKSNRSCPTCEIKKFKHGILLVLSYCLIRNWI